MTDGARTSKSGQPHEVYLRDQEGVAEIMRAVGEPPERVIIDAKAIIDRAVGDLQQETNESRRRGSEDAELRGDLIRWTIDAYFHDELTAREERP